MAPAENLTPTQRQGVADAFRAARERIAKGSSSHVCIALTLTEHSYSDLAKTIIDFRLNGCITVYNWLVKNNHLPAGSFSSIWTPHSREYRLRWLDALIEEFSQ